MWLTISLVGFRCVWFGLFWIRLCRVAFALVLCFPGGVSSVYNVLASVGFVILLCDWWWIADMIGFCFTWVECAPLIVWVLPVLRFGFLFVCISDR